MPKVPNKAASPSNLQAKKPRCGFRFRRTCRLLLALLLLILLARFLLGDARPIRKFLGNLSSLPTTYQWDYKYALNATKKKRQQQQHEIIDWSWMNTSGITLKYVQGDPNSCQDVIYTGHSVDPMTEGMNDYVHAGWKGLSYAVKTFKMLNKTCAVYFQIDDPFLPNGESMPLHSVWGRVSATALVMRTFPKANFLLYLDSDALIAFPDQTPTTMYHALSYDGYGENATFRQLQPALIVNKPYTGWLCLQCGKFGLGHGCINSGALLWHRSKAARIVVQAWWESRLSNNTHNLFAGQDGFFGWGDVTAEKRRMNKMGEQNRLMYIYHTNQAVRDAVWPVPRQVSDSNSTKYTNSTSCPNAVEGHVPCLQFDFPREPIWNASNASCFNIHYTWGKEKLINQTAMMLQSGGMRLR
jgi:galactosyl transferase GMA12/MNN10 family